MHGHIQPIHALWEWPFPRQGLKQLSRLPKPATSPKGKGECSISNAVVRPCMEVAGPQLNPMCCCMELAPWRQAVGQHRPLTGIGKIKIWRFTACKTLGLAQKRAGLLPSKLAAGQHVQPSSPSVAVISPSTDASGLGWVCLHLPGPGSPIIVSALVACSHWREDAPHSMSSTTLVITIFCSTILPAGHSSATTPSTRQPCSRPRLKSPSRPLKANTSREQGAPSHAAAFFSTAKVDPSSTHVGCPPGARTTAQGVLEADNVWTGSTAR